MANNLSQVVPMEVLVLGLSRTGTSSIQKALIRLGYPKVYHTRTVVLECPDHGDKWAEFLERKFENQKPISKDEWDKLLVNFNAVTDVPCSIFWRELIEAYPHAKVILTVRDSTEVWYKSYSNTIEYLTARDYKHHYSILHCFPLSWILGNDQAQFDRMIQQQVKYTPRGNFEAEGKQWYEEHNQAVKAAVPRGNLLIFNVKEGWEPLCQFLGKPIPQEPFPKVFDTKEYREVVNKFPGQRRIKKIRRLVFFAIVIMGGVALGMRWPWRVRFWQQVVQWGKMF